MLHRLLDCSATSLKLVPPPSGCSTSLNGTHLGVAFPSPTSGSQPRWLFNSCEWLQFFTMLCSRLLWALCSATPQSWSSTAPLSCRTSPPRRSPNLWYKILIFFSNCWTSGLCCIWWRLLGARHGHSSILPGFQQMPIVIVVFVGSIVLIVVVQSFLSFFNFSRENLPRSKCSVAWVPSQSSARSTERWQQIYFQWKHQSCVFPWKSLQLHWQQH